MAVMESAAPFLIFLVIIFIAFVAFAAIAYSTKTKRRFKDTLRAVALETGCSFDEGGWLRKPKISGVFRNKNVVLDLFTEHRHAGKSSSSTDYTRLQVSHAGKLSGEISIYPENFFSSIGKKLGMQDIQTGNAAFDNLYIVKSRDIQKARELLDLDLQQKLIELKMPVQILSDKIYMQKMGYITDKSLLTQMLNLMADLAEKVEAK